MLKKGFTLAEVLLTLTIIGVIAAITMPALMTNVNDNILEAQAKKFYSQLTDALDLYKERHEVDTLASGLRTTELASTIMNTTVAASSNAEAVANDLVANYMNINRNNGQNYNVIFGDISENNQLYKLRDGSVFTIRAADNNRPWIVAADVNGRRGPNRFGEDVWTMVIGTDGKIRIQGNHVNADNCVQTDNQGSCMALFAQNNFRFRNYRDAVAQGVETIPEGNNGGNSFTRPDGHAVNRPEGGVNGLQVQHRLPSP